MLVCTNLGTTASQRTYDARLLHWYSDSVTKRSSTVTRNVFAQRYSKVFAQGKDAGGGRLYLAFLSRVLRLSILLAHARGHWRPAGPIGALACRIVFHREIIRRAHGGGNRRTIVCRVRGGDRHVPVKGPFAAGVV